MQTYTFIVGTQPDSETYWDILAYFFAQFPALNDAGVTAYTYEYVNVTLAEIGFAANVFIGYFMLPNPSSTTAIADLWAPTKVWLNETYPGQTVTEEYTLSYSDFYDFYIVAASTDTAGADQVIGSWLLPPESLTDNSTALKEALETFMGGRGAQIHMVSGKGTWDAEPRGGSDAVNTAWRKALVHASE